MKFYILLFANQELYEFLCHVLMVFKILMIERQSLQVAVGFEGTNSQTRPKKHYATLLSLQQVGPLLDFINPQCLLEAIQDRFHDCYLLLYHVEWLQGSFRVLIQAIT